MTTYYRKTACFIFFLFLITFFYGIEVNAQSENQSKDELTRVFQNPPESAKPRVFWYWMKSAVTREGITADLEAMKEMGIVGAHIVPIQGATNPPIIDPPVNQLTPEGWAMWKYALQEANRLGIKITIHVGDGFATAGGPWITPELSMQKVVWSNIEVEGGKIYNDTLPQPPSNKGYYRDIAILAYPVIEGTDISTSTVTPKVTTNLPGVDASFLSIPSNNQNLKSSDSCWIQYAFEKPFTCRSIITRSAGNNIQSHRLRIESSKDGVTFRQVCRLQPPRHGWLDTDADVTHSIPVTTARYFRFVFNKEGSEPGGEDLDAGHWKPDLKIKGILLSSAPVIHQYEGKSGVVWRVSKHTPVTEVPDSLCIPVNKMMNITPNLDKAGKLIWEIPKGKWIIFRVGYTTTGHQNATAGAGIGLECDKFNPVAVKLQYNKWVSEMLQQVGPEIAKKAIENIHIDSWECGSQNWSPVFLEEFRKRRGYDPLLCLPAMAGIPVQSIDSSENFLYDIRQTISELYVENFYGTLAALGKADGFGFTGESVAPVMTGDGMQHYKKMDIPMGEFWVNSPTHDKPTDMNEAISAAHVYGKNIIQAEAFSTLRMDWNEYPGMLKPIGDRNYALGINRFVFHVFSQNPWPDRKPGMTLGPTGLFFQPTQTWWKPARAWMEYTQRCQALLQMGRPVVDIAIFTGEEIPRRAVLPERLVSTIPGIIGKEAIEREKLRLKNYGTPVWSRPDGVTNSSNTNDPANWIDPLHGYKYDSFNPDALLNLASVNEGHIDLPGGAKYSMLIVPSPNPMMPDSGYMSVEVAERLDRIIKDGAMVLLRNNPGKTLSLAGKQLTKETRYKYFKTLPVIGSNKKTGETISMFASGKGHILKEYKLSTFDILGIERDAFFEDSLRIITGGFAWAHRTSEDFDIYFISNQQNRQRTITASLRVSGRVPELFNPVTGETQTAAVWHSTKWRTELPLRFEAYESIFVVFQKPAKSTESKKGKNWIETKIVETIENSWQVTFDRKSGGPENPVLFSNLEDWTKRPEPGIKYYSGTATYVKEFNWTGAGGMGSRFWLDLGRVNYIAEVKINGVSCGIAWTAPYRVEITKALKPGINHIEIEVTNTWINRLLGDRLLPENQRIAFTAFTPYRLEDKSIKESGLLGPVNILGN